MAPRKILPRERIPICLWNDEVLHLPPCLKEFYISELRNLGMLADALKRNNKGDVGGESADDANNHFKFRFSQSSGRIEFAVLGLDESISGISDAFLSSFSVGHVTILDIPCGTGATSIALISTLVQLRKNKIIPRLPLTVTFCAGDYSPDGLNIYNSLMAQLVEPSAKQGITVIWKTHAWNAYRGDHTAQLMDSWFRCAEDANEYFVIIGNFSGALKGSKFQSFEPCFEHILARLHDKTSTLVWIEPLLKQKENLFTRLIKLFKDRIWWSKNSSPEDESPYSSARYRLANPLNNEIMNSSLNIFKRK